LLAVVQMPLVAFRYEPVQEATGAGSTFTGTIVGCG
jgi:hypothetical protein